MHELKGFTGGRAKLGTIWQRRVCHEKLAFGGRKLPDTSRESTKVWQIRGVCV